MQPKAAKKIGGMTPKKMTGGVPFKFEDTDYEITKDITKEGKLTICVSTNMPGAEVKEEQGDMQPPLAVQAAEIGAEYFETGAIPEGEELTKEVVEEAKRKKAEKAAEGADTGANTGGKKKRKSSKKRKSMKKKGGMRKSMKVKA